MNPPWRPNAPTHLVKLAVGRCLAAVMDASKWTELGLLTDTAQRIESHPRLIRTLYFGDDDYNGHVFSLVPLLLNEQQEQATPAQPQTLQTRFPNLNEVSEFIGLPEWLAENDEPMFRRLFDDVDGDATMPDGTVLSAVAAAAARLEVDEMRRQVDRIRRDHSTDPEAAVGQAKDLIETVCKTILGMTGDAVGVHRPTFPQLVERAMLHLGIDPTQVDKDAHDPVQMEPGHGLVGMRERAALFGGSLTVTSEPGFTVDAVLPLEGAR